jgi:hypothetical protein
MLRIQQRKDLYEDVYQQVLQGCEGSATQEGFEALQREAQTVSVFANCLRLTHKRWKFVRKFPGILLRCARSKFQIFLPCTACYCQIEDAVHGVGGWGDQGTRIKERRIVLCVDKAAVPAASGVIGASSSNSSSGAGGVAAPAGKLKFRKLNNGAGTTLRFVALNVHAPLNGPCALM